MALSSLHPYSFKKTAHLSYEFLTKHGITYRVYFMPVYDNYPELLNTYSFSIEPESNQPHPIDRCIADTVATILKQFFETIENAMIMVCDNSDGKQRKRRNLFNRWFHYYNDGSMTTFNAEAQAGDYELLLSIYFRNDNPYRQQIAKAFGDLVTRDVYEIII
jgi:hypothetical protein